MPEQTPKRWQADLALALVALVWGTTFVIVKQAITTISAMYFLSLRFSLAAICLLALFLPELRRLPPARLLKGLRGGFIAGLFLWSGYVLQTFGLHYTSAAHSGFLTGLYIVLVPIFGAVIYRQKPSQREILGLSVAAAGMVMMTFPYNLAASLSVNSGDLLTIGCSVGFAFHLLVLSYFSKRESVPAVALGQIACAALLSTFSLVVEPPVVRWSANVMWAIIVTAVFATALAFALQTWGQKHTTPTRTAVIFALEPVFALLTALSFGEQVNWLALTGGALIIAGILTVELKASPATA